MEIKSYILFQISILQFCMTGLNWNVLEADISKRLQSDGDECETRFMSNTLSPQALQFSR
jgi:hypothetical protein